MQTPNLYKYGNQYWEKFLMNPRYRIFRHLIILLFLGVVVMKGFFEAYDILFGFNALTFINVGLIFTLWGIICLNTYVLIPNLLYKSKYGTYLFYLLILTLFLLSFMGSVIYFSKDHFPIFYEAVKPEGGWFVFFFMNFLGFFFYISAFSMTIFLQRWIMHNRQLHELEKNEVQMELARLKDQIQPDFLSRMLNTANVLTRKDPEKTSSLLFRLSHVLRYQLYDSTREKVLLSADIAFIKDYMNLEKIHNDRFNFSITTDEDIEQILVPPLLFIPVIEHALGHLPGTSTSQISDIYTLFKLQDGHLYFACIYPTSYTQVKTTGLDNLYRRLQLLYGDNFSLETKRGDKNNITSLQICL